MQGKTVAFLSRDEVLEIHRVLLQRFGGPEGVRDLGLLESALFRPQSGYYESLSMQAAALFQSLCQNHCFVDGNKRVAFAWAIVALYLQALIQLRQFLTNLLKPSLQMFFCFFRIFFIQFKRFFFCCFLVSKEFHLHGFPYRCYIMPHITPALCCECAESVKSPPSAIIIISFCPPWCFVRFR